MSHRWIDEYLARPYEPGWLSTGNYYYERKFGRQVAGRYDAWNSMVSALGDLDRPDTQHATARLILGIRKPKWRYGTDSETGASEFVVGMCLLASHLSGRAGKGFLQAKVTNGAVGVYLMFPETDFADAKNPAYSKLLCEGVVCEVRKLHAKLLNGPQTIPEPDDVRLGLYR